VKRRSCTAGAGALSTEPCNAPALDPWTCPIAAARAVPAGCVKRARLDSSRFVQPPEARLVHTSQEVSGNRESVYRAAGWQQLSAQHAQC
jgi:hypothetical protein